MTLASPDRLVALVALTDQGQEFRIAVRPRAVAVIGEPFTYQERSARMVLIGGLAANNLIILDTADNLHALRADDEFVFVEGPQAMHFYVRPELAIVIGAATTRHDGARILPLYFRGLDVTVDVLDTPTNRLKLRVPSSPAPEILAHG